MTKIFHKEVIPQNAVLLTEEFNIAFKDAGCNSCAGLCCHACSKTNGFLLHAGLTPNEVIRMKFEFDWSEENGFGSPTGCKIPFEQRSPVCVGYWCGHKDDGYMLGVDTPAKNLPPDQKSLVTKRVNKFIRILNSLKE